MKATCNRTRVRAEERLTDLLCRNTSAAECLQAISPPRQEIWEDATDKTKPLTYGMEQFPNRIYPEDGGKSLPFKEFSTVHQKQQHKSAEHKAVFCADFFIPLNFPDRLIPKSEFQKR